MSRINIALGKKTLLRVKVVAALRGTSLNAYIVEALERRVAAELKKRVKP